MDIALERVRNYADGILDLSHLGLTELPPLPATLRQLCCSHNRITALPDMSSLLNLWYLGCSYNTLTVLPDTLPTSIQILNCSYNNLSTLPGTLPTSLEELYCFNNVLTSLPYLWPPSLNLLYCHHNAITALPTLPSILRRLNCSYNAIEDFPKTFPSSIQGLNSSNNPFPDRLFEDSFSMFHARVLVWSREQQEQSRIRTLARTLVVKEELMMERWSPARVEALMAAGPEGDAMLD